VIRTLFRRWYRLARDQRERQPGEIMKLRIAIWDTSDHVLDSIAMVDGFQWSVDASQPVQ